MKSRLLGPILIILFIALVSSAVIYYGRGYRVDLKKRELKGTGLLAATSSPQGASIFVDDRLLSATNETMDLEPGWYDVRLVKEGYIPWEKKMELKKEIVAETNATLFPSNPSLSPLTSTGVEAPSLSPDGTKIAYIVPYSLQATSYKLQGEYGVFLLNLNSHPLSFSRKPSQIFSHPITPQEEVSLLWSPSSTQVLFLSQTSAFLLDLGPKNQSPVNLIGTLPPLFETWKKEKKEIEEKTLTTLPEPLIEIFKESTKILNFSPDETKILYQATASATISKVIIPPLLATNPTKETRELKPGKIYVYDRKEDRNYEIEAEFLLRGGRLVPERSEGEAMTPRTVGRSEETTSSNLQWLPTSRHLILTEAGSISIMEYDGTNKAAIYASSFEESFVAPWPDGSKLVILTSLNPATATLPNLYTLSLR